MIILQFTYGFGLKKHWKVCLMFYVASDLKVKSHKGIKTQGYPSFTYQLNRSQVYYWFSHNS